MIDENELEIAKKRPLIDTFALFAGGCGALASRLVVHPGKYRYI